MGQFNIAYQKTVIGNEGSLNPGNGEAFTYRGIDESQNPNWPGFAIVHKVWDSCKPDIHKANSILNGNKSLQGNVQLFYTENYWNTIQLNNVNDQQVCNLLFDDSVNPCEISVGRVMQAACNACNVPVTYDGIVGNQTIAAINSITPKTYYNAVVAIRKFHYNDEVIKHPSQRQWLANWLARLVPYVG